MQLMAEEVPAGVEVEDRACPLGCPRNDQLVLMANDRLHGLPGRYPVVKCGTCGLMRTNPRPTARSIAFYYPTEYAPYAESRSYEAHEVSGPRRWIRKFVSGPSNAVPDVTPGHLLEFGCASGAFLAYMARRGWTCEGIEFSEAAAQRAQQLGFRVQVGALEDATPPTQPCDLIAGWMVLEHLHEPIDCLRQLRGWARDQGWLAVSVPDIGAFDFALAGADWYGLHVPNHLYHFDRLSIRRVMDAAGWKVEALHWHRNFGTPLQSLHARARGRGDKTTAAVLNTLEHARLLGPARATLGIVAGCLRQSGRMTVWAGPRQ
jgi:SAM-dependent methyltransferase